MDNFTNKVAEIYTKIHDIPILYCIIIAVLLPFIVIAVGYVISLIGEAIGVIVGIYLDPVVANAIINYAFFPGVMIHEMSHATLAILTGAKITEIALFKKEEDSLGHVNFKNRGNPVVVALQNIFTSSAPMFVGGAVVYGCFSWIGLLPAGLLWLKILLGYIGVSMFFHMTMSPADIKVYVRGIPFSIAIIFIIAVVLRLTNVI